LEIIFFINKGKEMTTQNSMASLETWVRQLNGELDVSMFSKPSNKPEVTEYVKEFNLSLNEVNSCQWVLTSGKSTIKTRPNIRFTFDAKSKQLTSVEMIRGGYVD
jgi:hypothetical protein